MFKKLLCNLPFNPSLIGEVSFYARRMHRESMVRRAGFIILGVAIILQVFAVVSPPESSLASSDSDMIVGGFSTQAGAVNACQNNVRNYKTILAYYGIDCSHVASASTVSLVSTSADRQLYTMGHLAYGKAGETPVNIPNVGTVYLRYLWSWDTNGPKTYKVLKGTNKNGTTFYLNYSCGNLIFIGIPQPIPDPIDVCPNIPGNQTKEAECDVCPTNPGIQTNTTQCDLCPNLPGTQSTAQCDVCPNVTGVQSSTADCDVCPKISGIQISKAECDVCPSVPGQQSSETECKPCSKSQTKDDLTACLEYRKTVSNITQKISDANGTTAKAGDVLTYTLTTTNKGKITLADYVVNENISDVLDYANVTDLAGGTKNQSNIVSWPAKDIAPNKTITVTFSVRVKDPIPSTPVSSSDGGHFDLTMTNVYGNTVSVKLPPSVIKVTEVVATTLPNTGPGASLIACFIITLFIGYLFARSRLLSRELDVVRSDFSGAGAV